MYELQLVHNPQPRWAEGSSARPSEAKAAIVSRWEGDSLTAIPFNSVKQREATLQACIAISLGGFRVCVRTPEFGKPEGRTADPSTTLPRISCRTWWR
jgi:hypothetical protein